MANEKSFQQAVQSNYNKANIGFTLVGWGIWGTIAYYKWNKSTGWKIGLAITGILNVVRTVKDIKGMISVKEAEQKTVENKQTKNAK